jgi:hypothetical protein
MKNHQKGFILPVVVVIISLLAIGTGAYFYENSKLGTAVYPEDIKVELQATNQVQQKSAQDTNTTSISACTFKNKLEDKNRCYEDLAIKNADMNICSKITIPGTFDHCIVGVAGITKNVALCAQVKSSNTRNICYGAVAYHTLDLSLCDQIIEPHPYPYAGVKDLCYANVARESKNVSMCEQINIPKSQDPELGPLPSNFQGGRVYCYQQVAQSLKDKAICKKITSVNERNKCVSGI